MLNKASWQPYMSTSMKAFAAAGAAHGVIIGNSTMRNCYMYCRILFMRHCGWTASSFAERCHSVPVHLEV